MSWLDGMKHRLRTVFAARAYETELDEEMDFHVELDALQQGDVHSARRRFGNRLFYREETRRQTWLATLDVLRQDAGYAWRSITRAPGMTLMVVLTLALGIGVNGAVFTVLDRLYLRPPAGVNDPSTVQRVWLEHFNTASGTPFIAEALSYPQYRTIAESTGNPARVAAFTSSRLLLGTGRGAAKLRGAYASANYFEVLGVQAALGRLYTADEDRLGAGERVVVLSHGFWKRQLAADPAILGKLLTITSNNFTPSVDRYTVIGVAEPSFTGVELQPVDLWLPLSSMPVPPGRTPWWESPNNYSFQAIRRVAPPGTDRDFEARATLLIRAANRQLMSRPDTLMNVYSGSIIQARGPGKPRPEQLISTRLGAVGVIVLLIACANVINLLLAQALQRRRETAMMLALGISRSRLIRLRTTETIILALLAGIAALFSAWWGGSLLRTLLLPDIEWVGSALDFRVLLFTAGIALFTGLLTGAGPAVQATNLQLSSALKTGGHTVGRQRSRVRGALVVTQAALSVALLVGSTLFVRSLRNVQSLDIGFDMHRLVFGVIDFAGEDRPPEPVVIATMREIGSRLERRPGIEAVARATMEPMRGFSFMRFYFGADSSDSLGREAPVLAAVSPGYFQATGVRLLRGRGFTGPDLDSAPAEVVLNEAAARALAPHGVTLGQCLRFEQRSNPCYTVVGIVENARLRAVIEEDAKPQMYLPLGNPPDSRWSGSTIIVRARENAMGLAAAELRNQLQRAFPGAEAVVTAMRERLEPQYRPWRLGATLFTAFGLLALLVAVMGIYTTVSYGVTQRTQEFGLRAALGARTGNLVAHVVWDSLRTVAVGVVAGVMLALAAGRLIATLLYGIEPGDPGVLLLVSVTLLAVAALAALAPAWRAARVDPLTALRAQ